MKKEETVGTRLPYAAVPDIAAIKAVERSDRSPRSMLGSLRVTTLRNICVF
jgi:hypothetical protein